MAFPAKINARAISDINTIDTNINKITVRYILFAGNKKTKDYLIKREMQIKEGDQLKRADIKKRIEKARQFVYNTALFDEVNITYSFIHGNRIDITTEVKERWYIYPIPQFQLVDRNFNDWLNNYNADLSRVNYGLKFTHYNTTGRRDQLRFTILNGFTRMLSFSYTQPYSNKALTEGFTIGTSFSQTRELAYITSKDKTLSYSEGNFANTQWQINGGYIFTKGAKEKHTYTAGYLDMKVPDSIIIKNPDFFNDSSVKQRIIDFTYNYQYIDVDNVAYPLTGEQYMITAIKRGLGLTGNTNMFSIEGWANKFKDLHKEWYLSLQGNVKVKLPFKQPYINQRALGYGEAFLRGMENYVVDGVAYALAKTTLKKKLVQFNINLPIRSKTFNKLPFTIFAKTFADFGYSYNKNKTNSYFSNRFLSTGGVGIDVLGLYNINVRIEYSFNQLGEKGLFLRTQSGF